MYENVDVLTHSCIRIEGTKPTVVIYFDPFHVKEERNDADIIFITHAHEDHYSLGDIAKLAKPETEFVFPKSMKKIVDGSTLPSGHITYLTPESRATVRGVQVETVRAYNVGKDYHARENDWLGYIITVDDERYFVTGDTDRNADNEWVMCDVVLLPIGGTYTFDASEAADFVKLIQPQCAIPTHYADIVGTRQDSEEFVRCLGDEVEVEIRI